MRLSMVDIAALARFFAGKVRERAKDAGEACGVPGCNALTLGVRCDKCYRQVCNGHAVWTFSVGNALTSPVSAKSYCQYCLLSLYRDIFSDVDVPPIPDR